MRIKIYYLLLLLLPALLFSANIFAQDVAPETGMRSNGKIYVVVAICVTILVGLIVYVASIDRKIGKLEKQDNHP